MAMVLLIGCGSTPHTAELTPQEQAWVTGLRSLSSDVFSSERTLHTLEKSPRLLVRGSRVRLKVMAALQRLQRCTRTLRANGTAPTSRLRPVARALGSACSHYDRVGSLLIRGINAESVQLVNQSARENDLALPYLNKATRLLAQLKG
jgi:hypothetical protein